MTLYQWASRWGVSWEAVVDLQRQMGLEGTPTAIGTTGASEAGVQNQVRLEAGRKGVKLWRNNVGALETVDGRHVRFGLANDSAVVNARIKSADLIGIKPVTVVTEMLGCKIGQFVSREIKAPGWTYTGTPREEAQKRWMELVLSAGGDAAFATGEGTL